MLKIEYVSAQKSKTLYFNEIAFNYKNSTFSQIEKVTNYFRQTLRLYVLELTLKQVLIHYTLFSNEIREWLHHNMNDDIVKNGSAIEIIAYTST